jgi:GHKL domain
MASWIGIGVTAALSLILSYLFLRLRFRGIGPIFGPRSRLWAIAVIAGTGIAATGLGLILLLATDNAATIYLGLLVPSLLWLPAAARRRIEQQGRLLPRWVPSLLERLYDRMGDDMQAWTDIRVEAAAQRPEWIANAAVYYYAQVQSRLRDERALDNLRQWHDSILHKASIVRLISLDTTPTRIQSALQSHPSTSGMSKYEIDDLDRLSRRLLSDMENELRLFLAYAYRHGYQRLLIYPFRPSARDLGLARTATSPIPSASPPEPVSTGPAEPPGQPGYLVVSEMAHSMKTPLAHLESVIELLRRTQLPAEGEAADMLSEMSTSVNIVKATLAAYREVTLVADQIEPRASESLGEALEAMHKIYARQSGKRTKLEVKIPNVVPGYSVNYLLAVLFPLLENAVEASPDAALISITAEQGATHVSFTVKNDVAVPVDVKTIGKRGQTTKPGHDGLGISVVRHLVSEHADAATSFDYRDNQFTFTITLPRRES